MSLCVCVSPPSSAAPKLCQVLGPGALPTDGAIVEKAPALGLGAGIEALKGLSKGSVLQLASESFLKHASLLFEVMSAVGVCEKLGDEKLLDQSHW